MESLTRGAFKEAARHFGIAQREDPTDLASATLERAAHLMFEESQQESTARLATRSPVVVADLLLVPSFKEPLPLGLSVREPPEELITEPMVFFEGRRLVGAEDEPQRFRGLPLETSHRGEDYLTLTYGDRWIVLETADETRVFDVGQVVPADARARHAVRFADLLVVEASGAGSAFGSLLFAFREATGELVWKSRYNTSNVSDFVVAGPYAVVGFKDPLIGGAVSLVDLRTGTTAFQTLTSAVYGLAVDDRGIVATAGNGSFAVQLPDGAELAPRGARFTKQASPQAIMALVRCAVAALARSLDARDPEAARRAIDGLDRLVAPRGLLRAARAAASRLEGSHTGIAWDLQARAPTALSLTAPVSKRLLRACGSRRFIVKWTDRGDPAELSERLARFGASRQPQFRGHRLTRVLHPMAPARFGDETLDSITRRGDVETILYGDRFIVIAEATTLLASFDTGQSAYASDGNHARVLDVLRHGELAVIATSGADGDNVAGHDLQTGQVLWRRRGPAHTLHEVDGQILAEGFERETRTLRVLCPTDGRELARAPNMGGAQEVTVLGDRVLVTKNKGAMELELR